MWKIVELMMAVGKRKKRGIDLVVAFGTER
jgi:hypothetical protein